MLCIIFAVPGYEDPTDKAARRGAVAFVIVGVIAGVLELLPFRRRLMSPHRPVSSRQTAEPLNDAEGPLTKMKNKVRDE